jgi:prophage antirepressor-like protein
MTNQMIIFNNAEFGEIRTVEINNEPWFVGKDVASALGYTDTVNALKAHVDEEDKLRWQITTSGQNREMTIINESGLYSLIMSSHLEKAKQFKRWVTSEILPSIRKTGSYTIPQPQPSAIDLSAMELEATGKYADVIAKRFNLTQEHAMLYAMNFGKAEGKYKAITDNEIETFKKLLPPIQEINTAKFNATKLGKELQNRLHSKNSISAQKINDALCALGYQTKIQGIWELTDSGKEYANSFAFDNHGHTGFQILWKSDVLDVLEDNRELFRF